MYREEVKSKKRILKKMLENVKKNFESDPKKPAWNPAGNKLTICTGCGETVKY